MFLPDSLSNDEIIVSNNENNMYENAAEDDNDEDDALENPLALIFSKKKLVCMYTGPCSSRYKYSTYRAAEPPRLFN